jgi:two-component system LytT family response regulator
MRVLVVDDEPLARTALRNILSKRADIEEFDVVDDAWQALSRLRAGPYDLLLLDIHMPELSGLELLERVGKQHGPIPAVVFVTAHHEHAVEAFRRRAIDYVVKPFSPERVHEALNAALRRSSEERAARLIDTLRELHFAPQRAARIAIKDRGRIVLVDAAELISAEAQGNYVLLRQKGGSYLLRETICSIVEKLKPYGFIRVHRSALVNVAFVETIEPGVGSECILRMKTGEEYAVTRTYRENLKELAQFFIGTQGFGPRLAEICERGQLREGSAKLKGPVADLSLDKHILAENVRKKSEARRFSPKKVR